MIERFYLTAATKVTNSKSEDPVLKRIRLDDFTLNYMIQSWEIQFLNFINDIEEVDLQTTLKTEGRYRISVTPYELPIWIDQWSINGNNGNNKKHIRHMRSDDDLYEKIITCLIAYVQYNGSDVLLFQNFSPSRIIAPNRILSKKREEYGVMESGGFLLSEDITAVYFYDNQKLLFNSYHVTNSFIPLDRQYEEASSSDIIKILSHPIFHCPYKYNIAHNCSKSLRRYFSKIKHSEILDRTTMDDIQRIAVEGKMVGIRVNIRKDNNKIIVPQNQEDLRRILILVNQDVYIPYLDGVPNFVLQRRPSD